MRRSSVLSLVLVLLVAACEGVPTSAPATARVQQQTQPTSAPASTQASPTEVRQQTLPAAATASAPAVPQTSPQVTPVQTLQPQAASTSVPTELVDEELGRRLQAAVEAAVASANTNWPGAVLHVRAPGLGAWSGAAGFGQLEPSTPMRPDDRFRAGSLTKPFISAAVLQLVEEGRFALDDPISDLLPDRVASKFAGTDRITVRMLLSHTSGLPNFMDLAGPEILAHLDKVWTAEEFLDFAAAQEPWFAPGTSQRYSNTGYVLLGIIVEEATGRTWREELAERIFEPLGLKDTLLPAPEDTTIPGDYAHGYSDFGSGLVDATELVTASVVGAAGGQSLITNASDLATFVDALLAGRLFKKPGTLDEMLTFVEIPPDAFPPGHPLSPYLTEYGLGLMKAPYGADLTAVGHSGDTEGGYHGFVFRFPDQEITISGAVNTVDETAGFVQLMPRVLEVLVQGYTMPEPAAHAEPDVAAAMQGLLDDTVRDQGTLGMTMAVRLADGTIVSGSSGHTDPAGEDAWTMDTVSALGSITKSFTAVVIMQLVQEGKFSVDDTIDTWWPDQPNGDKITVRMLLSHKSGLNNYISGDNSLQPQFARAYAPVDLVAEANRLGPVDEPGSGIAHYSNTAYVLLGMLVEKLTGNTWYEEVRSRIIEPLQLEHTSFAGAEGIWGGTLVPGYLKTPDGYVSTLDLPSYPHYSTSWAAGEMVGSLSDLLTFTGALFDGKLVSRETLGKMATPMASDPANGVFWGMGGAMVEGLPGAFGHEGGIPGYCAFYIGVLDTKLAVTTLMNSDQGDCIAPSIAALEYLLSLPPGAEEPAPVGAVAPAIAPEIAERATEWLAKEVNVSAEDLRLVGAEQVEWTDSCFGLGGPAESCLQAVTPGWSIAFEAAGKQYEVRSDASGSAFRLAPQGS